VVGKGNRVAAGVVVAVGEADMLGLLVFVGVAVKLGLAVAEGVNVVVAWDWQAVSRTIIKMAIGK
jgi:hypothetical protein